MFHRGGAIRAVIKKVLSGKIQRVDTTGRLDESHTDREMFQHYGFASRPLPESEGIMLFLGGDVNNAVVIATEDRRYRLALEDGEALLYTDEGDKVHLKRGNVLHVFSKKKILAESEDEVEVQAAAKATLKAPLIDVYGDLSGHDHGGGQAGNYNLYGAVTIHGTLHSTGNITSDGTIVDSAGNTNHHNHP